jgi:hypothetical protein
MYYRMQTDGLQLTTFTTKKAGPAIFEMVRGALYNFAGDPPTFRFESRDSSGNPIVDYISGKCLMSNRLADALEGAGVDNLQRFPAELVDAQSGAVNREFCVVNVVGLVAAADLQRSSALPLGQGWVFPSLTIDASKPLGLLMFRLAESLVDVIVHEQVASAIRAGSFRGVRLESVTSG